MGLLEFRSFGLSGEDDDICIDLVEGFYLVPSVRGRDWVVPKLDGQQFGNRRKDKLILPLAGIIKGFDLEDFTDNVIAVMDVMNPSLDPGELKLSLGYLGVPAGQEAVIQARVRNGSGARIRGYNSKPSQLWTFELEALIPEWVIGS